MTSEELEYELRDDDRVGKMLLNGTYYWVMPMIWTREDIDKGKRKGAEMARQLGIPGSSKQAK